MKKKKKKQNTEKAIFQRGCNFNVGSLVKIRSFRKFSEKELIGIVFKQRVIINDFSIKYYQILTNNRLKVYSSTFLENISKE